MARLSDAMDSFRDVEQVAMSHQVMYFEGKRGIYHIDMVKHEVQRACTGG